LKGHGFSRAVCIVFFIAALAAEGRQFSTAPRPRRSAGKHVIDRIGWQMNELLMGGDRLRRVTAPVGDFFQTFAAGVFEKSDLMAGVFEFVDVSPHFRLP
jgi:hypothetical protein